LRLQLSKTRSKFLYYRHLSENKKKPLLIELPVERSIYIVDFERELDEKFIKKYFEVLGGRIKAIHSGEYKNKHNNKKKRKKIFFCIAVYKREEDAKNVMNTKMLQSKIDKVFNAPATSGLLSSYQVLSSDNDNEEDNSQGGENDSKRKKMEEGGFTVVEKSTNRRSVTDGSTTVDIMDEDFEAKFQERSQKKKRKQENFVNNFYDDEPKKKKPLYLNDFYKFQLKDIKKQELEELRRGFEEDKKIIDKKKKSSLQKTEGS